MKNDAFPLNKLFVMRRSSGDAPFPKNIYEPRPAMVLIFKDYKLCNFEDIYSSLVFYGYIT